MSDAVRPFAEVREFNFNVRLKSQNGHLNQRWLMLGSFAALFDLPLAYPETQSYGYITKATIDGIGTAYRIRKGSWATEVFRSISSSQFELGDSFGSLINKTGTLPKIDLFSNAS